jgi:hypothetical protein
VAALAVVGSIGVGSTAAHAQSTKRIKKPIVMHGYTCTVIASKHHRSVVGHAGDVVCGARGNDTLEAAGAGHVVLIAGPGKDTLVASSTPGSQDTLIGGSGSDTIDAGSSGSDTIETGSGSDNISCGTGGATVTIAGADSGDTENSDCQGSNVGDASQEWHGVITAVNTDNTIDVQWREANDLAQSWLATAFITPPTTVRFDLTNAQVQIGGGGPLTACYDVEITANAPTTGTTLSAVDVNAEPGDSCSSQGAGDSSEGEGGAFGTVASVNGSSAVNACGTAATAGTLTLTGFDSSTTTVNVDATMTTFIEPGMSAPTFAEVCVGKLVGALGSVSSGSVSATRVFVAPAGFSGFGSD